MHFLYGNQVVNGRVVGFAPETSDHTSSIPHHGETPHHLRQSRIRTEVNGQDAGDKLRQMIAQNPQLIQPVVPAASSVTPGQATTSDEETSSEVS